MRLYVRDGIQASILSDFTMSNKFTEILTIECLVGSVKYVVLLVYHSPTASHVINNMFVDTLLSLLRQLQTKHLPLIICEDINLNLLNPHNLSYVSSFINGMFELGLTPAINIPTKVNIDNMVTRYSIIDQLWVSSNLDISNACVIPLDLTDHFPVGLFLNSSSLGGWLVTKCIGRPITANGKVAFRIYLSNINLENINGNHNQVMSHYIGLLLTSYNNAFPLKKFQKKDSKYAPWISQNLMLCIPKKKSKLYKLYLSGRICKPAYTSFKNRLTAVIRRAKRLHYVKLFYHAGCAPKQIWTIIDNLLTRKSTHTLKRLEIDGTVLTGLPLVNCINNYFTNAVLNITRGLTPPVVYPFVTPPVPNSCFFYPTTAREVDKVIMNLKNKGSKIHDIPTLLIKENKDIFAPQITSSYNSSLTESMYPDILKVGRLTPIYKSGPDDEISNYRPISSLPSLSKVYETLTLNRMLSFITAFSIFNPAQYGFRSGRSTTQAIIKLLSYVTKAYNHRNYCVCFFLDLKKAFDSINHEVLFKKLFHYGFRGSSHDYLKSYFTNRKQYVYLEGYKSRMEDVVCGVPQGSILGPLCFNLYINDLPQAVSEDCVLFADDAVFIITSPDFSDLCARIEKLFTDLQNYLNSNCLVPNATKSKLMCFSSNIVNHLPDFIFSGGTIEWVSEFKYLGLILTNKMSFGRHIKKVALNISRISGMVWSVRDTFPQCILLKLYQALALPHVNLHLEIWGSSPAYQINILEVKMNNLLRIIFGIFRLNGVPTMSTHLMYNTFGVLRFRSLFKLSLLKLLRALIDGRNPELFNILLRPYLISHNYGTRGGRFRHPRLTCEIERRFLPHQLILLYEELPGVLFENSTSCSIRSFKHSLLDNQ